MLGHGKCLKCKKDYPVNGINELVRMGWYRMTVRSDRVGSSYKYTGMLCPECAFKVVSEYFYTETYGGED